MLRSVVESTKVLGLDEEPRSWGIQVDVASLSRLDGSDRRVVAYLSNFATKVTDGPLAFAGRFTEAQSRVVQLRRARPGRTGCGSLAELCFELEQDLRKARYAERDKLLARVSCP